MVITPIGRSTLRYSNVRLSDGSYLHAVDTRFRWYEAGISPSHATNLPPC